jgi:hypothetical protein
MHAKIKKIMFFSTLMLFLVSIFTGCSTGDEKDEKDEEEAEDAYILEVTLAYKKACREFDFLTAHENLDKLLEKYLSCGYGYRGGERLETKFLQAVDYIYTQELTYLFNSDEPDISQKIIILLSDFPIIGTAPREGFRRIGDSDLYKSNVYARTVSLYNTVCNKVLDYCIEQGNKTLATKIVKKIKSVPYLIEGSRGDVKEGIKFYEWSKYIKYDKRPIQETQKKYNSAFN